VFWNRLYYTTDVDRFVETEPASTLLGVVRLFHPAILVEIEATTMV